MRRAISRGAAGLWLLPGLRLAGAATENWPAPPTDDGSTAVAPLPVPVEAANPLVACSGRFAESKPNDFGAQELPDRAGWVKAYHDFLARLRKDAPQAMIYCAIGPMLNDSCPAGRASLTMAREWIQQVVSETNTAGDARVRFLEFDQQNGAVNGLGANWHPSVKTHEVKADKFVATLRSDLHW